MLKKGEIWNSLSAKKDLNLDLMSFTMIIQTLIKTKLKFVIYHFTTSGLS